MKQTVKIKCPVCGTEVNREVETRINTRQQPQLKKALLNGSLQQFECANCGAKRQIQSELLYHDPDKHYMIFNIPNLKKRKNQVEAMIDGIVSDENVDVSDYDLRLVSHLPDLVEKTQLFDLNYDDREVEIVKLLTDGLFAKDRPNDKVLSRYFYIYEGQAKIMYITEKEQLLVDFSDKLLDFAKGKFKKISTKPGKGEFHLINAEWAAHALTNNS